MSKARTYAFDFDGVVADYTGFKGHGVSGKPNKEVIKAIRTLKGQGHTILLYSTRRAEFMEEYCQKYDIPVDYFNENPEFEGENPGKPIAYVYIDDRAIRYHGQNAEELVDEITGFKVWWKK